MMKGLKVLRWIGGGLLVMVLTLAGLERLAAERIEVVELHTTDADGEPAVTRLWVVDHEGSAYLRVGSNGSGWYTRLLASPTVTVERRGELGTYTPRPRPELSDSVNTLMQAKYTWGDSLIGALVGSREGSIPIELVPATAP